MAVLTAIWPKSLSLNNQRAQAVHLGSSLAEKGAGGLQAEHELAVWCCCSNKGKSAPGLHPQGYYY